MPFISVPYMPAGLRWENTTNSYLVMQNIAIIFSHSFFYKNVNFSAEAEGS